MLHMTTRRLALLALIVAGAALLPLAGSRARADGGWLDRPLVNWNYAGMPLPAAPAPDPLALTDPRCARDQRPAETAADQAVIAAGWQLFGSYEAGWGVTLIRALSGYDGMCRPFGYQEFVFADGAFAGTLAPETMNSRFDGALTSASLFAPGDRLSASFVRYRDTDPLCCPSAISRVEYRLDRTDAGPVLVPLAATTASTTP